MNIMRDNNLEEISSTQKDVLKPCCIATIDRLADCNPMMICQKCEYLIKCFLEEIPYNNYIKFCESQKRKVLKVHYKNYQVVSFPKQ